jgi:hypothetical protein
MTSLRAAAVKAGRLGRTEGPQALARAACDIWCVRNLGDTLDPRSEAIDEAQLRLRQAADRLDVLFDWVRLITLLRCGTLRAGGSGVCPRSA